MYRPQLAFKLSSFIFVVSSLTSSSSGLLSKALAQASDCLGLRVSIPLSVRYTRELPTLDILLSLYHPVCASIGSALSFVTSTLYILFDFATRIILPSSLSPFILPSSSHHTTTTLVSTTDQSVGAASV